MADNLQHQPAFHPVAQLVQGLQTKFYHPLQRRLSDFQNPSRGEVLAEQHTEHRGGIGVFTGQLSELGPGVAGIGGQQQLCVAPLGPESQEDLIPAGLIDLINLGACQRCIQFMDDAGKAECV